MIVLVSPKSTILWLAKITFYPNSIHLSKCESICPKNNLLIKLFCFIPLRCSDLSTTSTKFFRFIEFDFGKTRKTQKFYYTTHSWEISAIFKFRILEFNIRNGHFVSIFKVKNSKYLTYWSLNIEWIPDFCAIGVLQITLILHELSIIKIWHN